MSSMSRNAPYRLDDQIGFILRQANQRYAALFANGIGNGLTPTQWAALVRLGETGPCPQNQAPADSPPWTPRPSRASSNAWTNGD